MLTIYVDSIARIRSRPKVNLQDNRYGHIRWNLQDGRRLTNNWIFPRPRDQLQIRRRVRHCCSSGRHEGRGTEDGSWVDCFRGRGRTVWPSDNEDVGVGGAGWILFRDRE